MPSGVNGGIYFWSCVPEGAVEEIGIRGLHKKFPDPESGPEPIRNANLIVSPKVGAKNRPPKNDIGVVFSRIRQEDIPPRAFESEPDPFDRSPARQPKEILLGDGSTLVFEDS